MESRSKNHQSTEVIRDLVAAAHGDEEVADGVDGIVELDQGWFNAVYRVRLRSGRRVVLKIAPDPEVDVLTYERNIMRSELAAVRLLTERTTLPVPAVLFSDLTGEIIAAPWFSMEYVDGLNLGSAMDERRLDEKQACDFIRQIGTVTREINSVTGTHFGPPAAPGHGGWRTVFATMVDDLLSDAHRVGVDLGRAGDGVRAALDVYGGVLDAVVQPRLVSGDLWPGNVLVEENRIVGIVDHERTLWADPLMEAGFMTREIPIYPHPGEFVRGYGRSPFDESERVRRWLYSCRMLLIMTIEPAFRGAQDPRQSAWSLSRLRRHLALPPD